MAIFTTSTVPISSLIEDIDRGKIGLPELQRPFVWPNTNVRDLLDSLYRGYPAGFLLFWKTGVDAGLKNIGTGSKQAVPELAIVDGQQRLGKQAPSTYVPEIDAELSASDRERLYDLHALPHLWWEIPYEEFLVERRLRMAKVVRRAWEQLRGDAKGSPEAPPAIADLIAGGETGAVEFKSTLRINLHTGQPDDKMHLSALKTIAGFLNAQGGALLIGVADDGEVLGIGADKFPNEDKMGLHLVNLIKDRIGDVFLPYIHSHFEDEDGERVLSVKCEKGPKPAFLKDGKEQRFFVRGGNATAELSGLSITDYVKQRFG